MFGLHEVRATDSRNQNVSRARDLFEILAPRMCHGHGGVAAFCFLHQQQGDRFSNDHAPSKNDDVRAGDVDLAFDEESLNP